VLGLVLMPRCGAVVLGGVVCVMVLNALENTERGVDEKLGTVRLGDEISVHVQLLFEAKQKASACMPRLIHAGVQLDGYGGITKTSSSKCLVMFDKIYNHWRSPLLSGTATIQSQMANLQARLFGLAKCHRWRSDCRWRSHQCPTHVSRVSSCNHIIKIDRTSRGGSGD
jgi:hypothetical protein